MSAYAPTCLTNLLIRIAINPIVERHPMKKATIILPFDAIKRKGKHFFWERHKLKFRSTSQLVVVCNPKKMIAFKA
jgi:hypothetical protein